MSQEDSLTGFFRQQLDCWDLARKNFDDLSRVEERVFGFGSFDVKIQCNPARIRSTAAKVDSRSIAERRCFLCSCNRPSEQMIADEVPGFDVLVNPYPIFPIHYTVSSKEHCHQDCIDFNVMTAFARQHSDLVAFYNASKSGASAPDHLHFQAGNKDFLPICKWIEDKDVRKKSPNTLFVQGYFDIPMPFFHIIANADVELNGIVDALWGRTEQERAFRNVLMWAKDDELHILLFPRKKHRPDCYYAEGSEQMLVSPGAVDMAGVLILPRMEDFERITADDISQVYVEVSADVDVMKKRLTELNI